VGKKEPDLVIVISFLRYLFILKKNKKKKKNERKNRKMREKNRKMREKTKNERKNQKMREKTLSCLFKNRIIAWVIS
jgi:mannitol-specific phosphotransferase system IIBC component